MFFIIRDFAGAGNAVYVGVRGGGTQRSTAILAVRIHGRDARVTCAVVAAAIGKRNLPRVSHRLELKSPRHDSGAVAERAETIG